MDTELWIEARERLEQGEAVAFATIATNEGSTPRSAGAKLMVTLDQSVSGTVGGGIAEARAIEKALQALHDGCPGLFTIDMSGAAASGADLICGGMVRIFVQRLGPECLGIADAILERRRQGIDSLLLSPTGEEGAPVLIVPESDTSELAEAVAKITGGTQLIGHKGTEYLYEPLPAPNRLILAGGGHVSLAASRVATLVDFETSVLDDRPEFASPSRFPWLAPERVLTVPGFQNCFTRETLGFSIGRKCFIAILTRGHSYDGEVLKQALASPAGYIGMIGSRRKRDALYEDLLGKGIKRSDLEKVHAPIGLAIGAETPEEIAVSIVAELVAERAKAGKGA